MARVGLADIQYIEALRDQGFDEDAIVARTRWSRPVVREIIEGKHSLQLQYNHLKNGFTIEKDEPIPPWLQDKLGITKSEIPIKMHNIQTKGYDYNVELKPSKQLIDSMRTIVNNASIVTESYVRVMTDMNNRIDEFIEDLNAYKKAQNMMLTSISDINLFIDGANALLDQAEEALKDAKDIVNITDLEEFSGAEQKQKPNQQQRRSKRPRKKR